MVTKFVVFAPSVNEFRQMQLDDFDRRILRVVQTDNQKTHGQISEIVGLSASAVRRRLQELRQSGAIIADVSVVAPGLRGLTFLTQVKLNVAQSAHDEAFRRDMRKDDAVSQCYSVAGDYDYILVVHAKDPESYEDWGRQSLLDAKYVESYSSTLVWSEVKRSEAIVPH